MQTRSFFPLYVTNFFGVANDNFLKTLASFIVINWLSDASDKSLFMGIAAGALVLPFIFFSPLADRLTALLSKIRILRLAKVVEFPIVALSALGFACGSATLVVGSIVLMGLQSALYSPAKYALVRDVGGAERISTGMGGMEGVTFAAVLAGTIAGSFVADVDHVHPWIKLVVLFGFAALGLSGSYLIHAEEERNRELHAVNPLRYLRRAWRLSRRYDGLNAVILELSVFWFGAAMLQMGILVYGQQVLQLNATTTGTILALAAVGIVAGQVIAGFVDRRYFLLAFTPVTGTIAASLLLILYWVPMGTVTFASLIVLLAFDFGFFKLPFDTEIQKRVKGARLNTMLAYFNQVSFLFMLAASGVYALVSYLAGPRMFLLILAVVFAVAPAVFVLHYQSVLCTIGKWIFARRYAVNAVGLDKIPTEPCLLLPNHPAMVDPMLVVAQWSPRAVSPLCDELFLDRGGLSACILKTLKTVRVPDLRKHRSAAGAKISRGLTGVVINELAAGRDIIFYPGGHLWTEPREEIGTRQLAYNVCRELPAGVRVIGVRTEGLWGSIWSRRGRSSSPAFAPTLIKSVGLWILCLITRKRRAVTMTFEDLTVRVREWSSLSRLEFNRQLENWYNAT